MIGSAQFFFLIFILISTNYYFVCSTPHKWDLTNSANNVQRFGQFIDDILKNYNGFGYLNFKMRKLLLYYTFVKCVSEIAHFRVVNSNPKACANLNLAFGDRAADYERTIKPLERHIANEINKTFLCPEEPLPRAVVDQLLMLSFTFAMRFLVSVDYYFYNKWQLETLLSAYKILSTSNDDTNGVFPFQIFQFSYFKSLRVIEFTNQKITKEHTSEPNQYIENFKFLLKLSDYSLTLFEVYKLLETILIEAKGMDNESNVRALGEQPRALYTFVKQYFVENIEDKMPKFSLLKPNLWLTSKKKLLRCALVRFGMGFNDHLNFYFYYDFTKYYKDIKNECNEVEFKLFDNIPFEFIIRFFAIELELFHEPLTNYTKVIAKNDKFKGVAPFADAVRKMVDDLHSGKKITNGLFKSNEFQILFKFMCYYTQHENVRKLNYFKYYLKTNSIYNFDENSFLNDLRVLLNQIIEEYSYTNACQFRSANDTKSSIKKNIINFGQIFFEVFQNYSDEVKYDEKDQILSFPQMLAELFLERLYTLTQKKGPSICLISDDPDFVRTMQMIASTEQLEFVRNTENIDFYIANAQLFKLLFSLAFRLSLQIERSDLTSKYLKAFGFAYNCIKLEELTENYSFFEFKINISHKMVEINLPNWKLPDYMQNRIINELRQAKVQENFNFILSLSDYPLSLYKLLKMAKMLGKMEKNHEMWLNSSESKIFFEIIKYLNQLQEPIQKIKISKNKFCVLAYFVEDLLVELATENKIPNVESIELAIGHFILTKQEFCKENSTENDVKKYFDENLGNISKAINIDFNPCDELKQIVPEIVEEIKQIVQNGNWNYSHLNYIKIVEWDLLEFNLHKMGNDQKWEQIKQLRAESRKAYSDWYSNKNDENKFNFEETMKNLIQILEGI